MTNTSERARALEQALNRAIDRTIIAHGDEVFISEGYSGRESLLAYFAQEVAAVDPPPSGASPQAETSEAEEKYGTAFGRLDRESIGEHIASIKRLMGIPATVSPVEPTTCPKCRSNTRAYRLAVADVIDGRMAGMTSCRDEWHSRLPMVSPVEPEPPEELPCYCDIPSHILDLGCPRHQAPQCEPEPPWREKYNELLFAVARAYPGESRHDTALRYIREKETAEACGPKAPLKVER